MESILAKALGQEDRSCSVEEKRQLLSRLLARLAHEIRNPLSSLDIHLQLMEEDLTLLAPHVRDKLTARLDVIHGEIHRLETLVKQFLRLAGPSALDLAPVDLARIVSHVCGVLQPEAAAREIDLTMRLPEDLPAAKADAEQLTQATLNLVINALQAVEHCGRVEVAVSPAAESLMMAVQDSGPGVPAEALGTIFEPFYTTKAEGNGLGLWIAQQIIMAHGGTIHAANVPSGGALFTVRLPLWTPENSHGQIKD